MIFTHTARERGLWRGWLRNGQSVELSRRRYGWQFGCGVHIHSNDEDMGDRMLFLTFWRFVAVIPLGIIRQNYSVDDEPQWSAYLDYEGGVMLHWARWRKSFDLPGTTYTVSYEQQADDGKWVSVFDDSAKPYEEAHPYSYTLTSGEVQLRTATVTKRRHILNRKWLSVLGWPRRIRGSIDVTFSDEVGERSGSWKGGAIGCGYDLRSGETMLDALRRMERERKFT